MTIPYMFLTMIVLSLENPKSKIDVFMKPLINELLTLWSDGVPTYDISMKENFQMKVALMWTFNDFHIYRMLFS